MDGAIKNTLREFLSTPSVWRVTPFERNSYRLGSISIHTLRVEGDLCQAVFPIVPRISIHTLRVEGDPGTPAAERPPRISIHTLRVEGDQIPFPILFTSLISIHTLRVEGDQAGRRGREKEGISIHTLRVEGDLHPCHFPALPDKFLSTPSVWRVTGLTCSTWNCSADFYPHPPCGG